MTQLVLQDFPQSQVKVDGLVRRHLDIKDEPLLLAVYYASRPRPAGHIPVGSARTFRGRFRQPDRELFEIGYTSQPAFPLNPGQDLHLVLTNPVELEQALREQWPSAVEVQEAVKQGRYRILHEDPKASSLLEALRA